MIPLTEIYIICFYPLHKAIQSKDIDAHALKQVRIGFITLYLISYRKYDIQ